MYFATVQVRYILHLHPPGQSANTMYPQVKATSIPKPFRNTGTQ